MGPGGPFLACEMKPGEKKWTSSRSSRVPSRETKLYDGTNSYSVSILLQRPHLCKSVQKCADLKFETVAEARPLKRVFARACVLVYD